MICNVDRFMYVNLSAVGVSMNLQLLIFEFKPSTGGKRNPVANEVIKDMFRSVPTPRLIFQ